MRLLWQTEPGVRYDLWQSPDLSSWSQVPGFPSAAAGLAQEYSFTAGPRGFFRIVPIDEQPPVVTAQFPATDGFAISRFADFAIRLTDASGIDPASIRLTVGAIGPLALGASGLAYANGLLTYDSGALPLGAYGQTVTATLVAADTKGNTLTHTWSFKLEPMPQVAANIFVFGSPAALQLGQRAGGPAAALAARFAAAPVKNAPALSAWSIQSVAADRIVIAYPAGSAPVFSVGQLLCNLAPVKVQEIFCRRVLSVTDDPATSRLTVFTTDVPLTDLVQDGGVSFTVASVVYDTAADGTLIAAPALTGTVNFPPINFDLSGSEFTLKTPAPAPQLDALKLTMDECFWRLTPQLQVSVEIGLGGLKSFQAIATGTVSTALVLDADVLLVGTKAEFTFFDLPDPPPKAVYLGNLGPVPVWATLGYDFKAKATFETKADITCHFGFRKDASASFGVAWKAADGVVQWIKDFQFSPTDIEPFSVDLQGEVSLGVSLEPELKVLVYGLAGFSVGVSPELKVKAVTPVTAPVTLRLEADVNFDLALAGPAFESLSYTPALSYPIWQHEWPLLGPAPASVAFRNQPQSATVAPGAAVTFTCAVEASSSPAFQWFHNGLPIPGQTGRSLFLHYVNSGHAGSYYVRASAGSATANSQTAVLTVAVPTPATLDSDGDGLPDVVETNTGVWVSTTNTGTNPFRWDTDGDGLSDGVETHTGVFVSLTNTGTDPLKIDTDNDGVNDKAEIDAGTDPNVSPPASMVQIPAGSFSMGNALSASGDGSTNELPVHTVYVSGFYMDKYEVTKALWDEVRTWGLSNGYTDLPTGAGKAATHPVQTISWYSMVKWCNARSQKEGLTPVYYKDDGQTTIYKTGVDVDVTNAQVKWTANGYRLPTEAEWEKAAHGGSSGHRFPWSNVETTTHSQANYYVYSENGMTNYYLYDASPTRGYHPTYAVSGTPYTSPVGFFAPNGYGLYDMAGNVWERCWDWYGSSYYSTSTGTDPQGPPPSPPPEKKRVLRGGSWDHYAYHGRTANRNSDTPSTANNRYGFRCVRR